MPVWVDGVDCIPVVVPMLVVPVVVPVPVVPVEFVVCAFALRVRPATSMKPIIITFFIFSLSFLLSVVQIDNRVYNRLSQCMFANFNLFFTPFLSYRRVWAVFAYFLTLKKQPVNGPAALHSTEYRPLLAGL